jgi:hypothetical protein
MVEFTSPVPDVDGDVELYMRYLMDRLGVSDAQIVDYEDSYLRDVIARAIDRRRPCSPEGQEIRDAVLWLTVLGVAEMHADRTVVFISQNSKQFAAANELHPDLIAEAAARGVRVVYFATLEAFASVHATTVAFATTEWLTAQIHEAAIEVAIEHRILSLAERAFDWRNDPYEEYTGDTELVSSTIDDPEFFVYELADGSFRIDARYPCVAEVALSVSRY